MTAPLTLLDKVGLLAGQAVRLPSQAPAGGRKGRTCIDGGQGTLLTLGTDGAIGYALPDRAVDGLQFWQRGCFHTQAQGRCAMVTSPTPTARAHAAKLAKPDDAQVRTQMQTLASYGQVYMATALEPETGQSWLSFMLHPRQTLRPVLASLGVHAAWPELRDAFSQILGRPITENLRPWSVAIEARSGQLRIGTTAWARMAETPDKTRALDTVLRRFGADGGPAAAVYSLAQRAQSITPRHRRTGVAAEFNLDGTRLSGAMLTLRLPS